MIRNPFARRRRNHVDQVLDVLDGVRAEAESVAGIVRDAAARTADALAEVAPERATRRLPLVGAALAVGVGVAAAVRARAGANQQPAGSHPVPSAVETAARTTATIPVTPAAEPKPAAKVEAEQPKEPRAETEESAG